ncbi:MAG: hypothetical protein UU09_C0026G0013 [Microgenomates group bacterium GW2011_GWA2_40_6]|nr:MAG: hypothetical protein UU09_C0026G0013 [Microgenomates group bacterium GW2011_GWA2_40_6]
MTRIEGLNRKLKVRIAYLAKSIEIGETSVPRVILKAPTVSNENEESKNRYELLHKAGLVKALELLGRKDCLAVVLYGFNDFSLENALPEELIKLGEYGTRIERTEKIPVGSLILEGKITDGETESRLEKQMGADGQKVPMWVRARSIGSEIGYDVIDGYHRGSVLDKLKITLGLAEVSYGMSDEELYDQRVIAANSVRSVQFARVIRWMQRSFQESIWARDYKLNLSTVLGLAFQKDKVDQPGSRSGLTPQQAQEAIAWVEGKADLWQGELGTIYQQIRAAEMSFDEIVEKVRVGSGGGGRKGSGIFNPVKFVAMVEELRGDLHLQRKMLTIIKEHNLNAEETRLVARVLKLKRRVPSAIKALELDPINIAKEIMGEQEPEIDISPVGEETVSRPKSENGLSKRRFNLVRTYGTGNDETDGHLNPSVLADITPQHVSESLSKNGQTLNWIEQVPNISQAEKMVVTTLFLEGKMPETVCQELGITINKLEQLVFSAQRKYALHIDDIRFSQQFIKPR